MQLFMQLSTAFFRQEKKDRYTFVICFARGKEEVGEGREGGGRPAREGEGVARASVHSVPRPTLDAKKLQL